MPRDGAIVFADLIGKLEMLRSLATSAGVMAVTD
jgi:predicted LPLAT superfamily acyltransferase